MKNRALLVLAIIFSLGITPAAFAGASKEMVELQTQVQTLVQMQQKNNEEMGVLRDKINSLSQQTNETLSRVSAAMDKLDKSMQQQQASSDSCVDQLAGQTQPVHDDLTEIRSRIDAISRQLNDMNNLRQPQAASQTAPGNANPAPVKGPGDR